MNFADTLKFWADTTPDAPAVALGCDVVHSYSGLSCRVQSLAGGFVELGLTSGDRVALLLHNCHEYFECLLACWHIGLIPVPVNCKLHSQEFSYILQNCNASLCLVSDRVELGGLDSQFRVIDIASTEYGNLFFSGYCNRVTTRPDDIAWLFYTSGTTGVPKGAMLTHKNLHCMCECYFADVDVAAPWTAILHPAPLSHGSGLYALAHLLKGSCQVVPVSGGFIAQEVFELIAAWPGCVFFAAPTMIRRLTQFSGEVDTSQLKAIIFGGAPMYLEDAKAFIERFGPKLAQLYGQGESPMTITALSTSTFLDREHPAWERRIASAGTCQSAVEVVVVDFEGRPVEAGETGEIIVRGSSVMLGYWNNAPATAAAIRDGWLWTGDLGSFDEEGFLTLKDRSKDLVISGGSNIYPREVEEVLLQHPMIEEVAVIGKPDRDWGELVVAYVVCSKPQPKSPLAGDDNFSSDYATQLDKHCLGLIARFKRPRHYRIIDELPKNNYGKILKTELRELEALQC